MIKMGTDIHTFVETKRNDEWVNLALWTKDFETGKFNKALIYDGRNYNLFGLLAGVRMMGVEPISEPRGIPEDMSAEVALEYGDGEYYHDPTWYDFTELEAYLKGRKAMLNLLDEFKDAAKHVEDEEIPFLLEGYDELKSEIAILEDFLQEIYRVLDAYRIWFPKPGQIRVTMWFDS